MSDLNYGHPEEGHPLCGKYWRGTLDNPEIVATMDLRPTPVTIEVPMPVGFRHAEDLLRVARLVVEQLDSGMSVREILRRLHGTVGIE